MSCVARLTLACLVSCLFAIALPGPGQTQPVGGSPIGGNPIGVGVGDGPRFVVNALTFQALDETGWDWTGQDEVVFVFQTPRYKLITVEYGRINSNDSEAHTFKRRDTCVEPAIDEDGKYDHRWTCHDAGMPPPLSFVIGAYEQDGDGIFGFCATQDADTDIRDPNLETCEEDGELIGKDDVSFSREELLRLLPRPGSFFTRRLDLVGCDAVGPAPCISTNGPHYVVVYKVIRLPDVVGPPVNPNP